MAAVISWLGGFVAVPEESVLGLGKYTLKALGVWGIMSATCPQIVQEKNDDNE